MKLTSLFWKEDVSYVDEIIDVALPTSQRCSRMCYSFLLMALLAY